MNEAIDKHDLDSLHAEYVSLSLAILTDDITIDPTGDQIKDNRLAEIEDDVGEDMAREWGNEATKMAINDGYASGKTFEP